MTKNKPELIFGIIAKIGTDIDKVMGLISHELVQLEYEPIPIKLTKLMKSRRVTAKLDTKISSTPVEERYTSSMDACNELRKKVGNNSMANLAIMRISTERKKWDTKCPRAYIVRQFKRKEEIKLMRQVYGDRFVVISCYSPREARCDWLATEMAKRHHTHDPKLFRAKAEELILRDEDEANDKSGQQVRNAFPEADVIINAQNTTLAEETLENFFNVFFGNPRYSPTNDEYGMYMASSAALRSTDLSRKVGAAIFTKNLEVVTLGSNEVPKPLGGTYLQDDAKKTGLDGRDVAIGHDANAHFKRRIAADAVGKISKLIGKKIPDEDIDTFVDEHLYGEDAALDSLLIMDLTEFGRAVHAEMNALTDAARLGRATKGTTLYCTTFPCHNCAKHIVASGIDRVVYIQPYPKSRAAELYPDSISIDPKDEPIGKVLFQTHTGIAPHLYKRVYDDFKKKNKRGDVIEWSKKTAQPKINIYNIGFEENERAATKIFLGTLKSVPDIEK